MWLGLFNHNDTKSWPDCPGISPHAILIYVYKPTGPMGPSVFKRQKLHAQTITYWYSNFSQNR
jgi:hypothetical protein